MAAGGDYPNESATDDSLIECIGWLVIDNMVWPERAMGRTDTRDRRRVQTADALFAGDGSQSDRLATEPTVGASIAHTQGFKRGAYSSLGSTETNAAVEQRAYSPSNSVSSTIDAANAAASKLSSVPRATTGGATPSRSPRTILG